MKNLIFKLLGIYTCDHCGMLFAGKLWQANTYDPSGYECVDLCQRCGDSFFKEAVIEDKPTKRKRPPEPPYISTFLYKR